ncbi:hypothetical protein HOK51_08040 [Candidatus Woesearchaeota archaeon]|jgi:uncharacterized protein YjbI with pentapeptide repeats|nr:hypothetical protein [Candidatus Woesearchaeota archaeon]MBT6519776.1 hypothetical protein [Candidatus Woesearchaeota archaeon]MBT7368155.1 hypothetical protein [Candidatus Woesearchaeota archaeon]
MKLNMSYAKVTRGGLNLENVDLDELVLNDAEIRGDIILANANIFKLDLTQTKLKGVLDLRGANIVSCVGSDGVRFGSYLTDSETKLPSNLKNYLDNYY